MMPSSLKAGPVLIRAIELCYRAMLPLILIGRHGVGKSQLLEQAAQNMGIGFIVRDLSLMEPPDLIGLPTQSSGRTVYSPPNFLPEEGNGLLVFEELNRCPRFMRAPTLQLLTARSLNDYQLPAGWLPVAAINPEEDGYDVDEIDEALLSRFAKITVTADRKSWLTWANQNNIHPAVRAYVSSDPLIFKSPESNPRAWENVSDLLYAGESLQSHKTIESAILDGIVGEARARAFLKFRCSDAQALSAPSVLRGYTKHQRTVRRWLNEGKLDFIQTSLRNVLIYLQPEQTYRELRLGPAKRWKNLGLFLADLPADLQEEAEQFFEDRSYNMPSLDGEVSDA